MKFKSLLPAVILALMTTYAKSDVLLQYTGSNFGIVSGPYTTSDHVSGNFVLDQPLGDNLKSASVDVVSFSVSDGVQTLDQANAGLMFYITTGATGQIESATFIVSSVGGTIQSILGSDVANVASGIGETFGSPPPSPWTVSPIPEPSTWAMMILGFCSLGFLAYRKTGALRSA
jgi:hypothetical protein